MVFLLVIILIFLLSTVLIFFYACKKIKAGVGTSVKLRRYKALRLLAILIILLVLIIIPFYKIILEKIDRSVILENMRKTGIGSITPVDFDGEVIFKINQGRTQGLLSLVIINETTKEIVWSINMGYFFGDEIQYGKIPQFFKTYNGVTNSAKQSFPIDSNKPKPLEKGIKYKIYVDWGYDTLFSAGSTSSVIFYTPGAKEPIERIYP